MTSKKISNRFKLLLGLLILFLASTHLTYSQQTLETLNQSLRYSRYSRLSLKIIPIQEAERIFLLQMTVEKIETEPSFEDFSFSYVILSDFNEELGEEKFIPLSPEDLNKDTQSHFYFEKRIEVPSSQEMAIALLKAVDKRQGDEYLYHIDLISPFISGHPDFGAYFGNNLPFDQNYLVQNEALLFDSPSSMNLNSFYYPGRFGPPYPPMETKPAPVARQVEVIPQGEFLINTPRNLDKEGYYFIQSDTNSSKGLLIKTVLETFPRVATWDDMVEMVAYISTRREHESLLAAENKKIALDQYWIGLTKDPEIAKNLIREYFRQIEFANILFTDFKEGWKTDRGMVYVVMGPPNDVRFKLDREEWTYGGRDSISKITFNFARVKNILTPHYYTLNRSRALQPEWFKSITEWRSGKMVF